MAKVKVWVELVRAWVELWLAGCRTKREGEQDDAPDEGEPGNEALS